MLFNPSFYSGGVLEDFSCWSVGDFSCWTHISTDPSDQSQAFHAALFGSPLPPSRAVEHGSGRKRTAGRVGRWISSEWLDLKKVLSLDVYTLIMFEVLP